MVFAYYAQVLSIGLLWVTFHCSGMCGPIVAGLTSGVSEEGSRWQHLRRRAARVLAYQGGRAATYVVIGAAAGLAGAAMEESIRGFTRMAGLLAAVAIILVGMGRLPFFKKYIAGRWRGRASAASGAFLGRALRFVRRRGPRGGPLRFVFIGAIMGFLPCMLMFWVLGIAASTASPIHGAGVMALLVVLTTPVLLFAGCAAALPTRRLNPERLIPWAMIFSGVWMLIIVSAANGWIGHFHLPFDLFGERFVVMLW